MPLLGFAVFLVGLGSVFLVWLMVGAIALLAVLLLTATFATLTWLWFAVLLVSVRWVLKTLVVRQQPAQMPTQPRSSLEYGREKEHNGTKAKSSPDPHHRCRGDPVKMQDTPSSESSPEAASRPECMPKVSGTYGDGMYAPGTSGGVGNGDAELAERERLRREIERSLK